MNSGMQHSRRVDKMTESLRAALIQFLNMRGEAPSPASVVDVQLCGEDGSLDIWFSDAHGRHEVMDLRDQGVEDLLQFMLEYREV